jgi:hypothetical protein
VEGSRRKKVSCASFGDRPMGRERGVKRERERERERETAVPMSELGWELLPPIGQPRVPGVFVNVTFTSSCGRRGDEPMT